MLVSPFALAALVLCAGNAVASSSGAAQLDRRVTLVDPAAVGFNFSSVLTSQVLCNRPCADLKSLQSTCNSDNTCTETALCTTTGLNSLVTCNNCLLQLANRTTGVTQALYQNTTTILTDTESACAASASSATIAPPKANTTVLPWSQFVSPSSSATSTGGGKTESIGQAGDDAAAKSTSGTSAAGPRWAKAAGVQTAAIAGLVMAGLVTL